MILRVRETSFLYSFPSIAALSQPHSLATWVTKPPASPCRTWLLEQGIRQTFCDLASCLLGFSLLALVATVESLHLELCRPGGQSEAHVLRRHTWTPGVAPLSYTNTSGRGGLREPVAASSTQTF